MRFRSEIIWDSERIGSDNHIKTIDNRLLNSEKSTHYNKKNSNKTYVHSSTMINGFKNGGLFLFFLSSFLFLLFISVAVGFAGTKKSKIEIKDSILEQKRFYPNFKEISENKSIINPELIISQQNNVKMNKQVHFKKIKVGNNDTIQSVAKKNKLSIDTIILCNIEILNKKRMVPNMELLIPNQDGRLISVKQRDTLSGISKKYQINWKNIADANNLIDEKIQFGKSLFIPGSKMSNLEKDSFYEKKYIIPLKGRVTSKYGPRIDPISFKDSFHTGIDIKGKIGDPIKSIASGKIVYVGWSNVLGNYLMIKHNEGLVSIYGHLDTVISKLNDTVKMGELIGTVGKTGRSTGPHLHLEIHQNGKLIDPYKFLYK